MVFSRNIPQKAYKACWTVRTSLAPIISATILLPAPVMAHPDTSAAIAQPNIHLGAQLALTVLAQEKTNKNSNPSGTNPSDLEDLEERLETKKREEAELFNTAQERAKEIRELRYNLIQTANSIQESEREVARIERELIRLTREEKEASAKLEAESGNLSEILAALQAFELSRPPALLVSPGDANRAARAAMLLSEAAPALSTKATTLRDLVEKLAASRQGLADQQVNYERTAASLVARRQLLSELLANKEAERDVAASLAATAQRETAALAAKATSLKGVVSRLQRLAHAVTPRVKPPKTTLLASATAPSSGSQNPSNSPSTQDPSTQEKGIEIIAGANSGALAQALPDQDQKTPAITQVPATAPFRPARTFISSKGALQSPVVGRIIGDFGQKIEGERLDGLRIQTRDEAIVTAPYEARIVFAQRWGTIGNMIVLDVGAGYHILLMGIGEFLIEPGQTINAGEPVAQMSASTNILDIQIRKNGEPINPSSWMESRIIEESAF